VEVVGWLLKRLTGFGKERRNVGFFEICKLNFGIN